MKIFYTGGNGPFMGSRAAGFSLARTNAVDMRTVVVHQPAGARTAARNRAPG